MRYLAGSRKPTLPRQALVPFRTARPAALVRAAARDYATGSDCAVATPAVDARWWLVGGLIT